MKSISRVLFVKLPIHVTSEDQLQRRQPLKKLSNRWGYPGCFAGARVVADDERFQCRQVVSGGKIVYLDRYQWRFQKGRNKERLTVGIQISSTVTAGKRWENRDKGGRS